MNSEPSLNQPQYVSNENAGGSSINIFGKLFSIVFGIMKWFIGLRWYVILFIVLFGSYLLFQMEYAIESRRRSKEIKQDGNEMNKKEGMEEYNVEKIKGIIRHTKNNKTVKKHVSFYDEDESTSIMPKIYNLWILPWIYVLFRNIGIWS